MTKRLSKARRAEMLNRKLVIARAKHTDDAHMLQQGAVRCALTRPNALLKGPGLPRGTSLEGSGSRGKIVNGKFKPTKPGQTKPWSKK